MANVGLAAAPHRSRARLLAASSTDVWHLLHHPVTCLPASALWLPRSGAAPLQVVLVLAVFTPLELAIGARSTTVVFWSGHLVATLLTELPLALAIGVGLAPPGASHRLDVGVSYGLCAGIGADARLLERHRPAVVAVVGAAAALALRSPGVTSVGHLVAVVVGVCVATGRAPTALGSG